MCRRVDIGGGGDCKHVRGQTLVVVVVTNVEEGIHWWWWS